MLLIFAVTFFALDIFSDAFALSKKTKREINKYATEGKPGVDHKRLKSVIRVPVTNKKIQAEVSEKVFIAKPKTASEIKEEKSSDLVEVDIDPAAKTLLSALPKDGKKKPSVIVTSSGDDSKVTRVATVQKNDNFTSLFKELGYDNDTIRIFEKKLSNSEGFDINKIKLGQKFILLEEYKGEERKLISLQIPTKLSVIKLNRDGDDFQPEVKKKKTDSKYIYKAGRVKSSLVGLASREGIPNSVIAQVIRVLSNRYSLNSDVRKKDLLEVLYEKIYDKNGKLIDSGRVLYISMKGQIINAEAFRYSSDGNIQANFYDDKGRGFKKSLSRRPIGSKARISSHFGYRKHPVLKKRILHAGTDYAAPTGTPIYAGGDGTISKIGRFGGYGNYIKIKHDSKWETAYGHMSKFAKGMRKWKRVKKGQVIGYVGSTGRSTGPHLHYEIVRNGKPVNPLKAELPTGIILNKEGRGNLNRQIMTVRKILKQEKS